MLSEYISNKNLTQYKYQCKNLWDMYYKRGHNILGLLDILRNFPLASSETEPV